MPPLYFDNIWGLYLSDSMLDTTFKTIYLKESLIAILRKDYTKGKVSK